MPADGTEELRERVMLACRILDTEGLDDAGLGHVSARLRGGDQFLMKPAGVGLGEVEARDLVTLDLDGIKVAGTGLVHREWPLHAETYRARPDVAAVVHVHPLFSIALSASGRGLLMLSQDAALFAPGVGVHASPELVTTRDAGEQVVRDLGLARVLLLRHHGILAVGRDVEQATCHTLCLERAAKIQCLAAGLGAVTPMMPSAVAALQETFAHQGEARYRGAWDFYVHKLRRAGTARPASSGPSPNARPNRPRVPLDPQG